MDMSGRKIKEAIKIPASCIAKNCLMPSDWLNRIPTSNATLVAHSEPYPHHGTLQDIYICGSL